MHGACEQAIVAQFWVVWQVTEITPVLTNALMGCEGPSAAISRMS
jgi:hypothetical protein